jgi:hypothetical protein
MNYECYSYMYYIYTRKHHKEDNSFLGSSLRESSVVGSSPRDSSVRGSNLDGKLPLSLMSKGERFNRCMERELDDWRESTGGAMVTGEAREI